MVDVPSALPADEANEGDGGGSPEGDTGNPTPSGISGGRLRTPLLFLTVLVVSTSGLVYELLAGAYSSYVLGDSVRQFSTTIGVYLFAMGVGSYLSRFVKRDVGARFVEVELGVAIVGGGSVPLFQIAAAYSGGVRPGALRLLDGHWRSRGGSRFLS